MSRALCSARQLGPPGPVGPTLVPEGFGMEKRPGSFVAPHPLPGQVMEGLVSRLRPPGRCGEQVRTQLWPAGLPEVFRASLTLDPLSSVLRGPHKPPCLQLPSVPLSLRPQWGGQLRRCSVAGSSLVLENRGDSSEAAGAGGKGVLQNKGQGEQGHTLGSRSVLGSNPVCAT